MRKHISIGDRVFSDFIVGTILFLISFLLISAITLGVIALDRWSCGRTAQDMGYNHKYTLASGCMIETKPGKFIPLDKFRDIP